MSGLKTDDKKGSGRIEFFNLNWVPRSHAAAGFPILELIFVVSVILNFGMIFRRYPGRYGAVAIGLAVTGFVLFSIAKVSLFRRGYWFSFGSSLMTPSNRLAYRLGYAMIIFSSFMTLIMWFALPSNLR